MSAKLLAGVFAGVVAVASVSQGAVITKYDFTSSNTAASSVDPNATASPLTFGTSVNAPITTNDFYISKPVISISRSNDTSAQVYFQATVTAAPGYLLNMDSFTFDGARGGAATPRTYEVHSSVGGLAISSDPSTPGQVLNSGQFATARGAPGATDTLPTITTDLSSGAYDSLSTLTMRVFFNTPTVSQNIDIDNMTFNGTVFTAPEPASASTLALAFGVLGRRRRR